MTTQCEHLGPKENRGVEFGRAQTRDAALKRGGRWQVAVTVPFCMAGAMAICDGKSMSDGKSARERQGTVCGYGVAIVWCRAARLRGVRVAISPAHGGGKKEASSRGVEEQASRVPNAVKGQTGHAPRNSSGVTLIGAPHETTRKWRAARARRATLSSSSPLALLAHVAASTQTPALHYSASPLLGIPLTAVPPLRNCPVPVVPPHTRPRLPLFVLHLAPSHRPSRSLCSRFTKNRKSTSSIYFQTISRLCPHPRP